MQPACQTSPDGVVNSPPAATDADLRAALAVLRDALNSVLLGKHDVVELVLACLLARGHLLIEDRPGLGKTSLAKGLAAALGGRLARIQCTPDLLPGDITGFNVFNQKTREFDFVHGPVFADVLLCDEINRATPRTQSALLEAMAERQVTVDDVRYPLAEQFFVVATQNPAEQHGTFPLPEAQLDRFAMKLGIGYPAREYEQQMLAAAVGSDDSIAATKRESCLSLDWLHRAQQAAATVFVGPEVHGYLLDLAQATRSDSRMAPGVSPRGLLVWQRVSQAWAYLEGRDYVSPDDVQHTASAVLGVRLASGSTDVATLVTELLRNTPVPDVVNGRKPSTPTRSRGLTALLVATLFVGCGKPDASVSASGAISDRTDAARSTYEDHDHDVPEHKPASFPDGVEALVRRHGELRERWTDDDAASRAVRFQELCDIVDWLPTLAADGDLRESEWLPVKQAVDRMNAAYRDLRPDVEGKTSAPSVARLEAPEREFAELRRIAQQHADGFEVALHEHEHGHEHEHTHDHAHENGHEHAHDEPHTHSTASQPQRRPTVVPE